MAVATPEGSLNTLSFCESCYRRSGKVTVNNREEGGDDSEDATFCLTPTLARISGG